MNGALKETVNSDIFNSPNILGIPMTANVLNRFDPNTFPTAIACFPRFTAAILTMTSGKEVPIATPVSAITSGLILAIVDMPSIASIVYFAPKKTTTAPANKMKYSFISTFSKSSTFTLSPENELNKKIKSPIIKMMPSKKETF